MAQHFLAGERSVAVLVDLNLVRPQPALQPVRWDTQVMGSRRVLFFGISSQSDDPHSCPPPLQPLFLSGQYRLDQTALPTDDGQAW